MTISSAGWYWSAFMIARQRVGVHDLADHVEPGMAQLLDRARRAAPWRPSAASRLLPPCGADDREAVRRLAGAALERLDQRPPADGLVRDDERVLDRLVVEVDHDVLDRKLGRSSRSARQVAPQPARARIGIASR